MMDKVQKHNSFNTNTPSSESYRNYQRFRGLHPEDGGSMDLWNVCVLPQHYTTSEPRRLRLEPSLMWELRIPYWMRLQTCFTCTSGECFIPWSSSF